MIKPAQKPLLTREDLPIDRIVEICRRWNLVELSVDTSQHRPVAYAAPTVDGDPFTDIDLYLIADFGPGEYEWGFKERHFDVVADLEKLLGGRVWIMDKEILERHVAGRGRVGSA